ncbi:MAG: hypothetical protein J6J00_05885 [Treponema sp.]|nr:hypothetical protein [Treponema sp.]
MINIKNKSILLIAPKFFNYEVFIKERLESKGAKVFLIYENLDEINILYRFVYVYLKKLKQRISNHHYNSSLKRIKEKIDIVLVIRGSSITELIMDKMHNKYPDAFFVMYQWDSIKNNKNAELIAKYFNKCLTFDKDDARNKNWQYRPLFYVRSTKNINKDIDVAYICSIHSERIQILNKLINICKDKKLSLFTHVFTKRIIYLKRKYLDKAQEYMIAENKYIKFYSLSSNNLFDIYARSKIVVDYTNPNQKGLTMRTIECLGNNCKLVTNNSNLKDENIFNDSNYYIYQGTNVEIPDYLSSEPYEELNKAIYDYYSLDGWIETILETK